MIIHSDNTVIKRDGSYSKTVLLKSNPESLQTMTISFKKTSDFFAGIGMANAWNFRIVTVYDMQTNDKYTENIRFRKCKIKITFFFIFLDTHFVLNHHPFQQ